MNQLALVIPGCAVVALLAFVVQDAHGQAAINNGMIELGVSNAAALNGVSGPPSCSGTSTIGLRYIPTGCEATAAGCLCEGWGVAYDPPVLPGATVSGSCNLAFACPAGALAGCTQVSTLSVSTVTCLVGQLRVDHKFHPSAVPQLYAVDVTIVNEGLLPAEDVRYRRVMDWDVEPTPFSEYSTINGVTPIPPAVTYFSDNGFSSADPVTPAGGMLAACGPTTTYFIDCGPADHGAVFDFNFGTLQPSILSPVLPGSAVHFTVYYGAARDESTALTAIATVGGQIWSLGQCNVTFPPCSPLVGAPNTFVFAFGQLPPPLPGPTMHIGCGTPGPIPSGPVGVPQVVMGHLGGYLGTFPTCGATSPYGMGNPFYSLAGSCAGVPAYTSIPGAFCGPVITGGAPTCTAIVPPSTLVVQYGIMVGLDVNGDGWIDTSTGDLSSEAAPGTTSWTTPFPWTGPARVIAFPVVYGNGASPLPSSVTCS